jgi:tetratricopeptide (TPR) repeat protein
MRKINGKFFLVLLVGTAVVAGAVFGIHLVQYQRIAQALLWQARHAEEQHQLERTGLFLSRYLEFNPRDDAEKARLASLWASDAFAEHLRARFRAVRLLDDVLIRETQRTDLRRLLVKTALDLAGKAGNADMLKVARNHLEKLLPWEQLSTQLTASDRLPVDRERGELEGFWAQLLEAEGNPTEAIRCCRLALGHQPEMHATYIRIAYLLRRQRVDNPTRREQNQREADEWIHRLVTRNETKPEAYLARWKYRRDFDLIELRPDATPANGQVALSEAREDVRKALERAPDALAPEVYLAAADLERLLGENAYEDTRLSAEQREKALLEHRDTANEHLQHGLKVHDSQPARAASEAVRFQLLWHKAGLLLDDLKRADNRKAGDAALPPPERIRAWEEEVAATIEQARKMRFSPAGVDFLEGRLLVHQRRWAEGAQLFEHAHAVLGRQNDLAIQVNLYLGLCYEQLDEPSQMYRAYKAVAEKDPTSVQALLGMASADWALQRLDQAAKTYWQLVLLNRVPDRAWLDIARLEIQRQPQAERPDWGLAQRALENAAKVLPNAIEVSLLTAEMWVARQNFGEAALVLEGARQKKRNDPELWAARAEVALRNNDPSNALTILDEASSRLEDTIILRLARARYLVWRPAGEKLADSSRAKVRKGIDALAEKTDRFTEDEQARLLSGLAGAHLRVEDAASARRLWQRMAELPKYRTDVRLRLLLFDLALKMDDEPGMEQALNDIRRVERRDGAFARYGEALQLLWRIDKGQAPADKTMVEVRLRLDQALAQRPNWPPVYLVRAHVHEKEGNAEQAIKDLKEAIANGDTSPEVVAKLADLLTRRGRHDEADEELRRLQEPLLAADPDLAHLAANVAFLNRDIHKAVRIVKGAIKTDNTEYKQLIFLGRLLTDTKPQEAEENFRKALKLAPKEPAAHVAWVQFLARQKRTQEAVAAVEEAGRSLPGEHRALILGQCYEGLSRLDDAHKYYKEALEARRNDVEVIRAISNFYLSNGRVEQAEPLLQQMANGEVPAASPGDREWAKHGLALVLASGTNYERFQRALHLEGIELDSNGQLRDRTQEESTEQQKSQARVLATQLGQRQFRRRAIEMFEGLERTRQLLPGDRFILAILLETDGALQKSQGLLRELVEKHPSNAQFMARYTLTLLQREPGPEQLKEAAKWIGQLEDLEKERGLEPNTYASVEMHARLLEARGEGEQALRRLRKHLRREKAQPEEALLLLDSLRRLRRFAEAYQLCEQMWVGDSALASGKPCRPEVAGGASVAILRSISPTDEQVQRLEKQLREAITRNPKQMVLRLHLADLYDLRGRYADAEKLYREVLDLRNEPHNIVALNNLAWLLAHREGGAAEALGYIDAALHGVGRRADLLDTRALVYLRLGKNEPALADLREAIEDAATPTRQFHLAKAYHAMKNSSAAVAELKKAEESLARFNKPLPAMVHPTEQEECRGLLEELKVH